MINFAIQPSYKGRELLAIISSNVPYYIGPPKCNKDVPVGTVEWVSKFLSIPAIPDYYPQYLSSVLYRHVWFSSEPIGWKRVFIKPADKYKRFPGRILTQEPYQNIESGVFPPNASPPYWCSEVVKFTNEWRYYVSDGEIITTGWYSGDNEDLPAPELKIKLKGFGAFDFGTLEDGRLALVEVQHPFACGWYGDSKDHSKYTEWLMRGWISLTK